MSSEAKDVKKQKMSVLDQLKSVTTIVADTGDFDGKFRLKLRKTGKIC
jgi:hypothetical protein